MYIQESKVYIAVARTHAGIIINIRKLETEEVGGKKTTKAAATVHFVGIREQECIYRQESGIGWMDGCMHACMLY